MALTGGCDSDHGSADPEPSNQWTLDGATGTPIVHAAMKEADGTTYLLSLIHISEPTRPY